MELSSVIPPDKQRTQSSVGTKRFRDIRIVLLSCVKIPVKYELNGVIIADAPERYRLVWQDHNGQLFEKVLYATQFAKNLILHILSLLSVFYYFLGIVFIILVSLHG